MAWVPPRPSKSRKSNLGGEGKGFIDEVRLELGSEIKEAEFRMEPAASEAHWPECDTGFMVSGCWGTGKGWLREWGRLRKVVSEEEK